MNPQAFNQNNGIQDFNLEHLIAPEYLVLVLIAALLIGVVGLILQAVVIRMSCSLCSVEPPGFMRAVLIAIMMGVANSALSYACALFNEPLDVWSQLALSVTLATLVLSVTIPTNPISALLVLIVDVVIWVGVAAMIAFFAWLVIFNRAFTTGAI